jgi:acyl dehydratase
MSAHVFETLPPSLPAYARIVAGRRSARPPRDIDPASLSAVAARVPVDFEHLSAYRALLGLPDRGFLPILYPQVLAAPLHLHLLASSDFPFGALGIVHIANRVEQDRPIVPSEAMSLTAAIERFRETARGVEFDIVTRAFVASEERWRGVTTALHRTRRGPNPRETAARTEARAPSREPSPEPSPEHAPSTRVPDISVVVPVPEPTGRRYARLAGDFNPIHQHALLARPFGWKRAIVHGMWTLGRLLGELDDALTDSRVTVDAQFRKPLYVPSRVLFEARRAEGERGGGGGGERRIAFAAKSHDGAVLHLEAALTSA